MVTSVNLQKLHQELLAAGLPVVGVSSSGRIDYMRALTAAEQSVAQKIVAAHDPSPSAKDVFIEKLALAGISKEDVLYALWQCLAEGDEQAKDDLVKLLAN